jgi:hypothetical protein
MEGFYVPEMKLVDGYGPYRVDEAGVPFLNDVVWDFLERRNISAEEFGKQFGKLTRKNKQPYTKGRIYQMLHDNTFPKEKSRRWVLAKLLHIPPFLMGVQSLDELLHDYNQTTMIAPVQHVPAIKLFDYQEYKATIRGLWKQHRLNTTVTSQTDIDSRIAVLEKELLYGQNSQKKRVASLLCGYHMIASNIAADQQDSDRAITHLNHAYLVAKEKELARLQGATLLRRGWALKERGEEYTRTQQFDLAQADFDFAAKDFAVGLTLSNQLPASMQGSLFLSMGKLAADRAITAPELHQAMKKIDETQPFIGKKSDEEDIHFIQIDEELYYMDRAAAYLSACDPIACYPKDARRELRNALAVQPTPIPKRRLAYNMVLEAKSYLLEGHTQTGHMKKAQAAESYEQATKIAAKALPLVVSIQSTVNLSRIRHLCSEIAQTDYGKQSLVLARLEVEIAKAKYPQIFQ